VRLPVTLKNRARLGAILSAFGAILLAACASAPSPQPASPADGTTTASTAASPQGGATPAANAQAGYHVTNKYTIGGDAGWDYITIDPDARRLYVTHYQRIEVLDADTGKSLGQITDTPGAHGIALVKSLAKGFTTNGKADTVSVIDLNTLKHVAEIKAGKKPDAITYDPGTDRVFVSDGESDDVTVIDPKAGKVVATIAVGGAPEYSASDGKGTTWVNLEDKNAFVTIDDKALKVTKTTPIAGCEEPASMAFDPANRRLFIGCKNQVLAIVDPDAGKVIQTLPIGVHVDATIYDPANHLIFASTGDGFLTVVRQDSPDKYSLVENAKTMRGAKTLALDPKTGKLFSATVEGVPETADAPPAPIGKVAYEPGPFVVLEIGR
jgi:YVTN family beta-propeller protein